MKTLRKVVIENLTKVIGTNGVVTLLALGSSHALNYFMMLWTPMKDTRYIWALIMVKLASNEANSYENLHIKEKHVPG